MDSASAIEDPTSLAGETLHNQEGSKIGKINHVYGVGEGQEPMWVTVSIETGTARHQLVFVPMARLKQECDQVRVPYTAQHLLESPEVEAGGELSESDELALRNYYAIGLGDQEVRSDNETYAAQIPDAEGSARKLSGED